MAHLTPFLAIMVVTVLVSDRGLSTIRSAAGVGATAVRGLVDSMRTLGR